METLLIVLNFLVSVGGALSITLIYGALFLFDSPGSENNMYVWGAFWAMVALPFTCFLSVTISLWLTFKSQRYYKKALLVLCLPLVDIAIIAVCFMLMN